VRVVLDTNVWIAGLIARGTCSDLIEHLDLRHTIVLSGWIREETAGVLEDRFDYPEARVERVAAWMDSMSDVISLSGSVPDVCRDPKDNHVLQTADEGEAHVIVTGDDDLRVLETYRERPILAPDQFWQFETDV